MASPCHFITRSFFTMTQLTVLPEVMSQAKAIEMSSQAWNTTARVNEKLVDFILEKKKMFLYSAQNIPICEEKNWFCPMYQTHSRCFICHYFGHGIESCPNVTKNPSRCCIRCWKEGHASNTCGLSLEQAVTPPFKLNFNYPTDLLKKLLFL